jgi:uncharacterized protein (DUF427 family)
MEVEMDSYPITVEPNPKRIRVVFNGRVVAESKRAVTLREASLRPVQYIPREDADASFLERTGHRSHCPHKSAGDAAYFTLRVDGRVAENAVWSYEDPFPALAAIKGHLAFYPDRVDRIEEIAEP